MGQPEAVNMKQITKTLIFGGFFFAGIIALQYVGIGGKYLIWAAMLACLGMHFMMGHGGHGAHSNAEEEKGEEKKQEATSHAGHKNHGGGGGCCH